MICVTQRKQFVCCFNRRTSAMIFCAVYKCRYLLTGYAECTDVKDVFDLFDFWDGRDGLVDGAKIGDVMRCIGLNPTNKQILENGGTKKFGQSTCIYRVVQKSDNPVLILG